MNGYNRINQIILRRTDYFGSGLGMFSPTVVNTAYIQDQYGNYWSMHLTDHGRDGIPPG